MCQLNINTTESPILLQQPLEFTAVYGKHATTKRSLLGKLNILYIEYIELKSHSYLPLGGKIKKRESLHYTED